MVMEKVFFVVIIIYKVKNDYFDSLSFIKGIWIINDIERQKIIIMLKRNLLDVKGFQVYDAKCWKYMMIITFFLQIH